MPVEGAGDDAILGIADQLGDGDQLVALLDELKDDPLHRLVRVNVRLNADGLSSFSTGYASKDIVFRRSKKSVLSPSEDITST